MKVKGIGNDIDSDEECAEDHCQQPRGPWKKYVHARALQCILANYLSPNALYASEFVSMFWISQRCFEHLMSTVMSTNLPFYKPAKNCHGGMVASLETDYSFHWRHWHTEYIIMPSMIISNIIQLLPEIVANNLTLHFRSAIKWIPPNSNSLRHETHFSHSSSGTWW